MGYGEEMKMSFAGYGIWDIGYGEGMKIKMKRGLKGKVTSDRIFFEKRRFNPGWKRASQFFG